MAHLKFDPAAQPQGFRPTGLSIFNNVDPDTLIREIVQNSIDAARAKKRDQIHVQFQIESVPYSDIPAIHEYQERFRCACESQRQANSLTQAESITNAIENQLEGEEILILWVTDNGIGLTPDNMDRLLSDGQSQKGSADSTGSYGNGHMTMFPASNLRYLLYGGIFSEAQDGAERIIAGHTILASHVYDNENCGANGYLVNNFTNDLFSRFVYFQNDQVPKLLNRKLDELRLRFDSGALIGIVGFNRFNATDHDDDVVEIIERVVASHFTPAIHSGDLCVAVQQTDGTEHRIHSSDLRHILKRESHRQRRRHNSIGPSGLHAWQTLGTLASTYSESLETSAGTIDIQFRPLRSNNGEEFTRGGVQTYSYSEMGCGFRTTFPTCTSEISRNQSHLAR